jgi:hypothetical protein
MEPGIRQPTIVYLQMKKMGRRRRRRGKRKREK